MKLPPYSNKTPSPYLTLLCDTEGRLLEIILDEEGLLTQDCKGRLFPSLFNGEHVEKALDFLLEVREAGATFDKKLSIGNTERSSNLFFTGIRLRDTISVVARPTLEESEYFLDKISYLNNDLVNSKRELVSINSKLTLRSAENRDILAELKHRVKNSFNMISSMIHITLMEKRSQETLNVLNELNDRVMSVSQLFDILNSSDSFSEIKLNTYLETITSTMISMKENISLETDFEELVVSIKQASVIGLITTELVTNAIKYAFPAGHKGSISISLKTLDGLTSLKVRDNGIGLPHGFNPSVNGGMGIKIVLGLSDQIEGTFYMKGNSEGTSCILVFEAKRE
ncbi:sensor histidine kinase [Treponema sp.]